MVDHWWQCSLLYINPAAQSCFALRLRSDTGWSLQSLPATPLGRQGSGSHFLLNSHRLCSGHELLFGSTSVLGRNVSAIICHYYTVVVNPPCQYCAVRSSTFGTGCPSFQLEPYFRTPLYGPRRHRVVVTLGLKSLDTLRLPSYALHEPHMAAAR
jgi:hypothetical protein